MPRQGFSYVTEDGFISFLTELEKDSWAEIDIRALIEATPASSLKASCEARWKLRLFQACSGVASAKRAAGRTPKQIDDEIWDPVQDKLDAETYIFSRRDDQNQKDAAERIRSRFLLGKGKGQTRLPLDKEVDHGRMQVHLANTDYKEDIALLGLQRIIAQISAATEEMATALGIGSSTLNTAATRQQKEREVLSGCVLAFSNVLDDVEWQLSQPSLSDEEKQLLAALQTPLLALLSRYPAPEKPDPDAEKK
jgi:hypothetical protein